MTYSQTTPETSAQPSDGIAVGSRAMIFPSQPQPGFDSVGGRAFGASYKDGNTTSDLTAILCDKSLPVRFDMITAMRSIDHPGILRLIDNGVVLWPHDHVRRYVFAYQHPMAPRLKVSIDEPHAPISDDLLGTSFIAPMVSALIELARAGVVHNAIRPTNIFWRIGTATAPQLGECLSAPAGYGQPALFEPLERAMAMPLGRGTGHHSDDCYAMGVTLALLILGNNPLQGLDDAAIIQAKMDRGSFGALIGNRRISPAHIELLRGLLSDDARQRWTGPDLEQWTAGRRLTPKSTDAGKRAARAFDFMGHHYWQVLPLAAAMAAHVGEAAKIIENGSLDKWLRRAVNDDARATNLADVQSNLKKSGKTASYEDQLVTRACIALDPAGPIRYRGLSVMPAGIGVMLADAIMTGNHVQVLSEIISTQLVGIWVEMQNEIKTEMVPLGQQLERMKTLIEKSNFGNGIERVVYELNPGLPCLSPMLRPHYVMNGKTLVTALEQIAGGGDRPQEPMDRHIAAFLIARERRSEMLFEGMTAPTTSPRRGLSLLTLYSELQERHGPERLQQLAQWMAPLLEPILQRFLGKVIKEKLREQVKEAVARGNLSLLLRLVDDPRRVERDQQDFMAARLLYLNIMKEIAVLENRIANREAVVRETGKPMAASISTFIAILLVFAAILRAVWQALV